MKAIYTLAFSLLCTLTSSAKWNFGDRSKQTTFQREREKYATERRVKEFKLFFNYHAILFSSLWLALVKLFENCLHNNTRSTELKRFMVVYLLSWLSILFSFFCFYNFGHVLVDQTHCNNIIYYTSKLIFANFRLFPEERKKIYIFKNLQFFTDKIKFKNHTLSLLLLHKYCNKKYIYIKEVHLNCKNFDF